VSIEKANPLGAGWSTVSLVFALEAEREKEEETETEEAKDCIAADVFALQDSSPTGTSPPALSSPMRYL
jgi:hypothetical protein